jgi:hypothetical protein
MLENLFKKWFHKACLNFSTLKTTKTNPGESANPFLLPFQPKRTKSLFAPSSIILISLAVG